MAYELLFSFQALGICLNTLAILGFNVWTLVLLTVTVGVALLGPRKPCLSYQGQPVKWAGQPVAPLPVSVFAVFLVNFCANILRPHCELLRTGCC